MKNLFLLWLILFAITCNLAFAEKAMSPMLIAPSNFAKNISKDSIKFTWQNAQNEVNAKVNAYRIVISENVQFNGYTSSTGRCNVTCVTSVINGTTFSTGLRLSSKIYYWRVQGISTIENGEWSRTGTFKTDSGAPTITNASATPSSTSLGNAINFSATLSSALPNNYNVKLNYGTSTVNMTWSGTSYNTSQIPMQLGQQVFTVGVYNSSDALKGTVFKGNFEITKSNSPPILSLIDAATTATVGTSYSVRLQASDVDNNLQSIILVWGDGVNDTQTATNGTPITYTHAYATANTYNWSATALDSGNASSSAIAKTVTVSAAVITPPVSTSGYTKISNSGLALPDTAILGSGPNDWACSKDNKTGLIWEVKTTDGGLRDMKKTYTNYIPGESSYAEYGKNTNSDYLVSSVNNQTLCGATNWRLPTLDELKKLVVCSDGKYETDSTCTNYASVELPTINLTYFPNTDGWYWSSSPNTKNRAFTWDVYFSGGYSYFSNIYNFNFVRLVRNAQLPTTSAYAKISNTGTTLTDSAVLGSGPNDWACTKDNNTGLIWEVKTTDGGLRDSKNYYSWYEPDASKNGGNAGYQNNNGSCKISQCDTYSFTNAVNVNGLCGKNDWRMPTKDELIKLVICSDGKYETNGSCTNYNSVAAPTINLTYFPNTPSDSCRYWSSSTNNAVLGSLAWDVNFFNGYSNNSTKDNNSCVRLVR